MLLLLLRPFNGLFSRTTWVSRYQEGKTSLDVNEARDDTVLGGSGISCTMCKQSAPRSRQITTRMHHNSIFTGRMLFLTPSQQCQSTEGIYTVSQKATHILTDFQNSFTGRLSGKFATNSHLNIAPHLNYIVSQKKTRHQTLGRNFANYYPSFKFFPLTDSVVNLQQIPV